MSEQTYMHNELIKRELLDGKPVTKSPSPTINHSIVTDRIFRVFGNFFDGRKGFTFHDPVDVHLTEKDVLMPDVFVMTDREKMRMDGVYGAPDLVVEVLAPCSLKNDRGYKKDAYERAGVKEYWIVDIGNRSVEAYLLKEAKFVLDAVHFICPEFLIRKMTDEEKLQWLTKSFSPVIFPDLSVSLEFLFANLIS